MNKINFKVILLFTLMSWFEPSSSELLRPPQPPRFDYSFNKFRPPPSQHEPTFIQRITNWFFPWGTTGGESVEENFKPIASSKVDGIPHFRPQQYHNPPISRISQINLQSVRDIEPTTERTTARTMSKCSPCNKVPWIPMMPTYQLPMVKGNSNNGQVYFKHYFGNENPYVQVPAVNYGVPASSQSTPIKIQQENAGHQIYGVPQQPSAPQQPIKLQTIYGTPHQLSNPQQYHHQPQNLYQTNQIYGAPLLGSNNNFQPQYLQFSSSAPAVTTFRPNSQTIDNSAITFTTTGRPQQHNRPLRFTQSALVTNPEYIPPPNLLPLEGENDPLLPVPIPNLSATPIPPLFDAQPFETGDPSRSQKTGFVKLVPLDPVAQLSNSVASIIGAGNEKLARFESPNVEVLNSNLVAEFSLPTTQHQVVVSTQPPPTIGENFRLNFNFANNLLDTNNNNNNNIRPTAKPEVFESFTDTAFAGSELSFQENVHQNIEEVHHDDELLIDNLIGKITTKAPPTATATTTTTTNNRLSSATQTATSSTGRDNYVVKFEPSIQTAADLAEKAVRNTTKPITLAQTTSVKPPIKTRNRLTPIELLDSPIFHLTPFASKTKAIQPVTESTVPAFKPMEDFTKKLATLWTTTPAPTETPTQPITKITPTTEATLAVTPSTSTQATTTLEFLSKLASGIYAGITPPREQSSKAPQSTKKPKQVQIVIPYTSFHKPSPFKPKEPQELMTFKPIKGHYVTRSTTPRNEVEFEVSNGHGFHNDQEYHDHAQESKIVESKVSLGLTTTESPKYITKILANNIRELLLKERTPKPLKIDLIRLQKNIDGWTEQSFLGKSSTTSLMGHTKAIPNSFFLPTTITMKTPTTTLSPKTTFDPDLMEETKRQYENILFKNSHKNKEDLYVKRHDRFLDRDNELVLINNNLTFNAIHDTETKRPTISPRELWKRLHVTISPLTNEKVYIVTPQPMNQPVTQESTTIKPRFAVRPTVGRKMAKELTRRIDENFGDDDSEVLSDRKIYFVTPTNISPTTEKSKL